MRNLLIGAGLSLAGGIIGGIVLARYQERRARRLALELRSVEREEQSLRSLYVGLVNLGREAQSLAESMAGDPVGTQPRSFYGRIEPAWRAIAEVWEQHLRLDIRDQATIALYQQLERATEDALPQIEHETRSLGPVIPLVGRLVTAIEELQSRVERRLGESGRAK